MFARDQQQYQTTLLLWTREHILDWLGLCWEPHQNLQLMKDSSLEKQKTWEKTDADIVNNQNTEMDIQCERTVEVLHSCREITSQICLPGSSSFLHTKRLICTQIVLTLLCQSETWKSVPPRQESLHLHFPAHQKCAFETNLPPTLPSHTSDVHCTTVHKMWGLLH